MFLGEADIDAPVDQNSISMQNKDFQSKISNELQAMKSEHVEYKAPVKAEEIKVISEENGREKGLIIQLDNKIDDDYIKEIKKQTIISEIQGKESFKIVYTPLHGTGGRPMERILTDFGYSYEVVKEQIKPDGNFPTVTYANPEEIAGNQTFTRVVGT